MKWLLGILSTFILALIGAALWFYLKPGLEPSRDWLWTPSGGLTLQAQITNACETGAIGAVLNRAVRQDILRKPKGQREEQAYRAFVCENHRIGPAEPRDLLVRIAETYPECFSLDSKALTDRGHRLAFSVRLDSPSVCAAPVRKQDGRWVVDNMGRTPRLLCWPGAMAEQVASSGAPRPCSRAELLRLDLPREVIDKIDR